MASLLVASLGLCGLGISHFGYAELSNRVFDNLNAQAAAGDARSQLRLADMYLKGDGIPPDCEIAIYWFKRAVENQNDRVADVASYALAQTYSDRNCVEYNQAEAAVWYEIAAKRGIPAAQNDLGNVYLHGLGVPQNIALAVEWFQRAAKEDNPAAAINLANLYLTGEGVAKNTEFAYVWMERAARRGSAEGQTRMAQWYYLGHGNMHDTVLAYMWASVASKQTGDTQFIAEIAQKLSKKELALAKKLADSCVKSDYRECDYAP